MRCLIPAVSPHPACRPGFRPCQPATHSARLALCASLVSLVGCFHDGGGFEFGVSGAAPCLTLSVKTLRYSCGQSKPAGVPRKAVRSLSRLRSRPAAVILATLTDCGSDSRVESDLTRLRCPAPYPALDGWRGPLPGPLCRRECLPTPAPPACGWCRVRVGCPLAIVKAPRPLRFTGTAHPLAVESPAPSPIRRPGLSNACPRVGNGTLSPGE